MTLSLPHLFGGQGIIAPLPLPLPLAAEEEAALKKSAEIIRATIDGVEDGN